MQRYVNPHPTMYPQQQPMQQPQQMQAPQIIMTQNGPMMVTPQGMIPVQIQQMQGQPQVIQGGMVQYPSQAPQTPMMPMQGGMVMQGQQYVSNPQVPQQFSNPSQPAVIQSRFGQPSTTMDMTTPQSNDSGNRYHTFQTTQQAQQPVQQDAVEEPMRPALFVVTPATHKFTGNEKFKMGVITEAIKPINMNFEEGFVACDCLEETVEAVIELAYKTDDVRMVTLRNYIVNNTFYKVDLRGVMDSLIAKDTKNLYKVFKTNYSKTTDKHQINVLNSLNTLLTDVINDFLAVNSEAMISIESFYTDYNDLLKTIGNVEEELEEVLVEYLDRYVSDLATALTNTTKVEKATQITEMVTIAYLDKLVQETGLDALDYKFVQLDESITNAFLKSIAAEVIAKVSKPEFLLVTLDKSIFKFMVDSNANVFVRKFA